MHIRPEIMALRRDDAPQRRLQVELSAVLEHWRSTAAVAAIHADLERFAAGDPLARLQALGGLFTPGDTCVPAAVAQLVEELCGVLLDQPLGQVPLRYRADALTTSLLLAQRGAAVLSLEAIDGAELAQRPPAQSVRFFQGETWVRVLVGQARVACWEAAAMRPGGAELACTTQAVAPGQVHLCDGAREALVVQTAPRGLVTLQLQRRARSGAVVREYRLADGQLLHQSAADPCDSRLELAAALLGRMGRRDAAPLLAAVAAEPGSASLRWQALRECLGLDSAAGFALLSRIAATPDDPLMPPAAALRAQLLETYPQLAAVVPCRA